MLEDRRHRVHLRVTRNGVAATAIYLFKNQRGFQHAESSAAVFLRNQCRQPTRLTQSLDEFLRIRALLITLPPIVIAEARAQRRHGVPDFLLAIGQLKLHLTAPSWPLSAILAIFPYRFAFLVESRDTLEPVFTAYKHIVTGNIEGIGSTKVAVRSAPERNLGRSNRHRRARDNLSRNFECRLECPACRKYAIDQTPFIRGICLYRAPRIDQFAGAANPDRAGEMLNAATARHDSASDFFERKFSRIRGNNEVCSQRQLATARISEALDGSD